MDGLILPILLMLIVALPLVMSTRKQKKAMAAQQKLQDSLAEGDRVMTTSGLYATVAEASDDSTIDLEIAEGIVTTWLRQAVRERIEPVADDEDDDEDDSAETASSSEPATEATEVNSGSAADSETSGAQVAPPLEHGKK